MSVHACRRIAVVLLALACLAPVAPPAPSSRIIAIGDVHGSLDGLQRILARAGLVDAQGRWTGGKAVLVQTGDFTDRGPRVRGAIELLMGLQRQAKRAGGAVHVLLGNHEALNLLIETRDVAHDALAEFADGGSERRRLAEYDQYAALSAERARLFVEAPAVYRPPPREQWLAENPPGLIEYLEALGPASRIGRWIRSLPVVVKVGDTIFMHAGIDPARAPDRLEQVNRDVRRELERFDRLRRELLNRGWITPTFRLSQIIAAATYARAVEPDNPAWAPEAVPDLSWALLDPGGPLWYRGFADENADAATAVVPLLEKYSVARFVVGHSTVVTGRILPRFSGRVILIDTGMLARHYRGRPSAVEISDGRIAAIYEDGAVGLGIQATPPRSASDE
jgi:hypothetical protein